MDYIEDQLQRTQPELLVPYHEALKVLETNFAMRFSFSALMLRETVRLIGRWHGLGKDEIASVYARKNCTWLPKDAYQTDQPELLSLKGHLLLSAYRNRRPTEFSESQNLGIDVAIAALVRARDKLNDKVHNIVRASQLSEAEGGPLIDEVLRTLADVLRLKRTILDIVEIRASDSVSVGISLLGGSYKREIQHPAQ